MEYVADELGVPVVRRCPALQRELSPRADVAAVRELRARSCARDARTSCTPTRRRRARPGGSPRCSPAARARAPSSTRSTATSSRATSARGGSASSSDRAAARTPTGALVAVSDEVRDDLVRLGVAPAERIVVIPYGFDLPALERRRRRERADASRRELGLPATAFVVGWAGRLTRDQAPARPRPDAARAASTRASTRSSSSSATAPIARASRRSRGSSASPSAAGFLGYQRTWPLVRHLRRVPPHLRERGHAGRRDRGARERAPGRRDASGRHGDRRPPRRDRLPGADRRHRRARRLISRDLARDPALRARARPSRRRRRPRRGSRPRRWPTTLDALYRAAPRRDEGPPHPQDHGHQRLRAPSAHAPAGAARAAGSTRASSGSTCRGRDAPRFYERLDELGVPFRAVRCTVDVNPRMARDVVRAVRAERPDLLHTHLVHGDVYGSIAAGALRRPVRLVAAQRRPLPARAVPPRRPRSSRAARRRIIAISDAVRLFLERGGPRPREARDRALRARRAPGAPARASTPADAGIPAGAPLVLAIGRLIAQKDHATLLRAFARVHAEHPGRAARDPRQRAARGARRARSSRELGLDDAVLPARALDDPRLARARATSSSTRRAGRGSGSCCSRRCSRGCRSSRRA